METAYKTALHSNYSRLVQETPAEMVLDRLYNDGVFSQKDRNTARGQDTSKQKTRELLDILTEPGEKGCQVFCAALKEVGHQHLADLFQVVAYYKWQWLWSKDGAVMTEGHRKFTNEQACRKEAERCQHPGTALALQQPTSSLQLLMLMIMSCG